MNRAVDRHSQSEVACAVFCYSIVFGLRLLAIGNRGHFNTPVKVADYSILDEAYCPALAVLPLENRQM